MIHSVKLSMSCRFNGTTCWNFSLPHRALLDALLVVLALVDTLHENAGRVNLVGVELADGHQLFHFGHRDFAGRGHHGVEVAGRAFVDEVAGGVAFPGFHEGEIGDKAGFHQVHFAVELAAFLAFAHLGAVAGRSEKRRNSCPAGSAALGQRALRNEFHFELAAE